MLKHKWMRSCLGGSLLSVMCSDQNQIAQSFSVLWLEIDGVQINYRDGGSYYCLFSPWFHVASFNRDAADRDDSAVSFSRHCGGLCCKMFVENHRRSFKLKNGGLFLGLLRASYMEYLSLLSSQSWTSFFGEAITVVQFLFPCPFDPLVLHFRASHSFRRVHGDTSRGHSIPIENKLDTNWSHWEERTCLVYQTFQDYSKHTPSGKKKIAQVSSSLLVSHGFFTK